MLSGQYFTLSYFFNILVEHAIICMLISFRFRIALRNVTAEDDVVNAACEQLRDNGFINYFGLQRFGTRYDVPTFDVGIQLLKGNFKEVS